MRHAALLILFFLVSVSEAFPFTGQVVGVLDGDTVEGLPSAEPPHNKKVQRIRLYGIDCPEKGHPYGNTARQATSAWALGGRHHGQIVREVWTGVLV